ncbi:prostaglandin reductase 1 isoform X2 [Eurytemora carolleeae]|uniref:prostaglandin reductase 1 isoform X2 n=1 Tax=Eurytemora carolleeae TaxID=1294199 RepID=UPI000C7620B3|nr:prostaglandin reductase 1 isoform X2 [Eurytemora carolleeae]|eukprot:XP_023329715.1 prostaglandin reductase 1-like isoform X2 [Eurytemora affinis]
MPTSKAFEVEPLRKRNPKMVKGRKWILKQHFSGEPKIDDFELVEEELPELKNGEIMFRSLYISVDPYQKPFSASNPVPSTMIGSSVAVVEKSKHKGFPEGAGIVLYAGWVERGIVNPDEKLSFLGGTWKYPKIKGLSPSMMLGACGMPGLTAYFGLLRVCEPKSGETVVVSGAAGAVGSMVGQIAKIKGAKTIGFTGSDEKVKTLKDIGFDYAFNYKKISVEDALKESAPQGVDCYFDNVGGDMSTSVLQNMAQGGRVSVCGAISTYNGGKPSKCVDLLPLFLFTELKIEGFVVGRWEKEHEAGLRELARWINEGKLKAEETVVEGFENTPQAFLGLFDGSNTGKMVVKV